jgi:hypothetical protein
VLEESLRYTWQNLNECTYRVFLLVIQLSFKVKKGVCVFVFFFFLILDTLDLPDKHLEMRSFGIVFSFLSTYVEGISKLQFISGVA